MVLLLTQRVNANPGGVRTCNPPARSHTFPLAWSMDVALSLVIPAYNEADRLPPYLERVRRYLADEYGDRYEVIVVDDGGSDELFSRLTELSRTWPQLAVLQHEQNRGKGAAVRTGMARASGDRWLFADADGAAPISQEARLRAAIDEGADVAVGSRLVGSDEVESRRPWFRALLGKLFAATASGLLQLPVRDTQCGFKMFRREAGAALFTQLTEDRFLFDLELLLMAHAAGMRIAEVPIEWSDQPGSRLHMRREMGRILAGLWRLRRRRSRLVGSLKNGKPL